MNRPTVLVVDDEAEIMRSLSFILSEDFHVLAASNGREGLSILDTTQPSLILLDLLMPEMDGISFLEHLRGSGSDIPVLVLTGNSCHEWAKRCADLNVQGYIEKPIDAEALIKRIKKVLGIEEFNVLRMLWGKRYEERMSSVSSIIREALIYLRENFHKNLSREELAEHLKMCPDRIGKQFYREIGLHIKEYVNMLKVHIAKRYLIDTDKSLSEIADLIGTLDASYFGKLLKKYTGATPKEFRENPASYNSHNNRENNPKSRFFTKKVGFFP